MSDESLLEELRETTRGLTYMSESDYPFEVFRWGQEPTPERLRAQAGADADAPVETREAADFFRAGASEPEWKGPDELADARKFQRLLRLLEENLADLTVYVVGEVNMPVYVAGRSASGAWVGVSTRVVET